MFIGRYVNHDLFVLEESAFWSYYPDFSDEHIALAFETFLAPYIPPYAYVEDASEQLAISDGYFVYKLLLSESRLDYRDFFSYRVEFTGVSNFDCYDSASISTSFIPFLLDYIGVIDSSDISVVSNIIETDRLDVQDFSKLDIIVVTTELLPLSDYIYFIRALDAQDLFEFSESLYHYLLLSAKSEVTFSDVFVYDISILLRDILSLFDTWSSNKQTYIYLIDDVSFRDVLYTLLDKQISKPISLYLDISTKYPSLAIFTNPANFIDGNAFIASSDGIYKYDGASYGAEPHAVIINPSTFTSSRIKRLDKIFASSPIKKAVIYGESVYTLSSNGKWVNIPKGIRSDSYEVVLYPEGDIEFIELNVVLEGRAK